MKKHIIDLLSKHSLRNSIMTLIALFVMAGCSEDISTDNFAIKDKPTATDYILSNENLSDFASILQQVRLSDAEAASKLSSVLAARGNYTIFAPTNEAIAAYLRDVLGKENISELTYEEARLIAYSCIIDCGTGNAYESAEFPSDGTFLNTNLNDRFLSCVLTEEGEYVINGSSNIAEADHETSNGYVHIVSSVIAPSSNLVPELIQKADNMKIFGKLLSVTGVENNLMADKDQSYEDNENLPEKRYWSSVAFTGSDHNWNIPRRRYLGFTGFVETDEVFQRDWGITAPEVNNLGEVTNWDVIQAQLIAKAQEAYPEATSSDLTSPENALNRFVSYHFIKGKIAYNRFVHHCCEFGYRYGANILQPQEQNYTVDVWDYFITVPIGNKDAEGEDKVGIIKVLQVPTGEHEIYLNRVTKYDNGMTGTYKEVSTLPYQPGINVKVFAKNGDFDNNAQNGFYYPIDGILVYDQATRTALGSERIRFDLSTTLPELISNNFRGLGYQAFEHGYFENVLKETEGTEIYYLQCGGNGVGYWHDYQGDEFLFSGLYDFVLRLPPVPKSGTYEVRMGSALNPARGMCQIYIGPTPDDLQPVGLPFDLRQGTNYTNGSFENADVPYIKDSDLNYDEEQILENDKDLRVHGYMKAPAYFWDTTYQSSARDQGYGSYPALRRIVTSQHLEADKCYYLRFKSALKKLDSQFFVDYFELVPTSVYNGVDAEDIW